MSTSRPAHVEVAPADLGDFLDLQPRPEELADWAALLERPDFLDLWPQLRAVVFRHRPTGQPLALLGVGALVVPGFPGLALPWVWAQFDQRSVRHFGPLRFGRFMGEARPLVQQWLDANAPGFFTAPQGPQELFVRTLRFFGFRHLGHGLWQWRS